MEDKKFEVVKPIVLSPEISEKFDEIGKTVREQFFEHRNREINEMLKPYNLTIETIPKSPYILAIQRTEEGFDTFVLAKKETQRRLTSIEEFVDQVVKNSGL